MAGAAALCGLFAALFYGFEWRIKAAQVGGPAIARVLIEFGIAVGKAERPIFPYRSSLNVQRKLMIGLMIVTGLLIALGGFEVLRLPR